MLETIQCDGFTLHDTGEELVLSGRLEGNEYLLSQSDVKVVEGCVQKAFPKTRFFMNPTEIKKIASEFRGKCDFISGISGYSNLDESRCRELNIRTGEYEYATLGLMKFSHKKLKKRTPHLRRGLINGGSETGIDLVTSIFAEDERIPLLSTTCLQYLWYVNNKKDGYGKVLIADSKEAYCKLYVDQLDLLLAVNGGEMSYKMDIYAATGRIIKVAPVDVLSMLGVRITPFRTDDNGDRIVIDAVGTYMYCFILDGVEQTMSNLYNNFDDAKVNFAKTVVKAARKKMPVKYAFKS